MRPEFERLFEAVRAGDTLIILLFVLRSIGDVVELVELLSLAIL